MKLGLISYSYNIIASSNKPRYDEDRPDVNLAIRWPYLPDIIVWGARLPDVSDGRHAISID